MATSFLQSFLKTGLFDINDNDDRLKKLEQSIAVLQKKLKDDYSLLPQYTLVAIDPNILDSEKVLIDTEDIIIKYWETLRSKYSEMPRSIIRGVILNALNLVGSSDPIAARIIYLTALNFYPYAKLGAEKVITEKMLSEFEELSENNALEEWSLIEEEPSLKLATLKMSGFKVGNIEINDAPLRESLKIAAKHSPEGYQQHAHPQQWSEHFSKNASEGIINLLSESLKSMAKSIDATSIETPLNKFFIDFKKTLDSNLKMSFSSLRAVERRSKLLWWKETLYSPSMKTSYRKLDKNLLPIIMGADLNYQVPAVTPISVDYLLRDTLLLLNEKKEEIVAFSAYLSAIQNAQLKSILKPYFSTLNESDGRMTITDFIALLVNDRVQIADFKNKTGIDGSEQITLSELSVVILHDLLVKRLISE